MAVFWNAVPMSIEEHITGARSTGAHKMSMLQDFERGRPLEISVRELAGLTTPTIDGVYALLQMRMKQEAGSVEASTG